MFQIDNLVPAAQAYIEKYPPDNGYTVKAAQAVYDAYKAGQLPQGTNIGVQLALQFDGAEGGKDLIKSNVLAEKQLPYLASYSLDKGADCMDFVRNLDLLLFEKNPGDWTQGAYSENKKAQVPWDQRREMDLLLFKLSSRNPDATHAALYIGESQMLHTRSKSKPLMVTADDIYTPALRTGTGAFRVLTDEEYGSLIVGAVGIPDISRQGYVRMLKDNGRPYTTGADVKLVQQTLEQLGFNPGAIDGLYGPKTSAAVLKFQKTVKCKPYDGIVGPLTWAALGL